MKKEERVKSNILFNKIINEGNKISNNLYTVFYLNNNNNKPLFGISSPKKLGNAVVRNKCRRQVRSILNNIKKTCNQNYNYIIIIKKNFLSEKYDIMLQSLEKLIGDIK